MALCHINGAKGATGDWFNPANVARRKRALNEWLPPKTAQIWLALADTGRLPEWATRQVKRTEFELAAVE